MCQTGGDSGSGGGSASNLQSTGGEESGYGEGTICLLYMDGYIYVFS